MRIKWRERRMIKFRLYYDKDKETEFINEMSRKGYAMTGFFAGFYSFDRCSPGEYIYQVDITEGLFRVSNDYREFMRDMNVEIVCLWGPWAVLRKRAGDGPFVLYTDVESNIEQYSKIRRMFKKAAALEIVCIFLEAIGGLRGNSMGWGLCFLLAAILMGIFRELARVNRIIAELKERIGEETGPEGRQVSGFIPLGFLLNAIGFLMPQSSAELGVKIAGITLALNPSDCFHILAIVSFIIGLVRTLLKKME